MKIAKMKKGEWGKIRAFFDLSITIPSSSGNCSMLLKGFKIIEGAESMFVGFPSQQDKDGNYFDTIYADKESRSIVESLAFKAFGDDNFEELVGSSSDDEDIPF